MFEYVVTEIAVNKASTAIEVAKNRAAESGLFVNGIKRVTQKGRGYGSTFTVVLMVNQ